MGEPCPCLPFLRRAALHLLRALISRRFCGTEAALRLLGARVCTRRGPWFRVRKPAPLRSSSARLRVTERFLPRPGLAGCTLSRGDQAAAWLGALSLPCCPTALCIFCCVPIPLSLACPDSLFPALGSQVLRPAREFARDKL